MILQSLYNYYQILRDDNDLGIAEPGYSHEFVSHALNLSLQGDLLNIVPLYVPVQRGKKTVDRPREMNVPERAKRSVNVAANFMWDNAVYVLGLTDKEAKDPNYAEKRFEDFCKVNIEILSKVDSPTARAVMAFLQKHNPQKAKGNSDIVRHLEGLMQGYNLIFQVEGEEALNDPKIKRAWEDYVFGREAVEMQCLVTGEIEPVERLHPDIKGVQGAQSKGAKLVSFNLDSFISYGREQGANSPVSRRVASGYGVALNYLLSNQNPNRRIHLGDTTTVYWADTADKRYASAFYVFLNPEYQQEPEQEEQSEDTKGKGKRKRAKETEKTLGEVAASVQSGKAIDIAALREGLDDSTNFYVLGLAPSAARLSVRFFLTEPFGVFAERIMQHYKDLGIEKEYPNQPTYISPYRILAECVSPKVTKRDDEVKKSWSLLGGAFIRAILTDAPYPEGLYAAIINRVRHDTDETNDEGRRRNVKINYIRAAYIKAHLLRKYRRQSINPYQEALQMSLNESYTNPAYVLGRLFAWLEKAQREALGKNINATIKDRYFTSACATPASVFPTLLRLSHHHIQKAEYGKNLDRSIQSMLDMLDAKPFPSRLTLEEQGVFVLGYYHQRAAFYPKKDNNTDESTQPNDFES
jgi:CRISPR-associated protein Csd1